jgi:hypothetical protein
MRVRTSVRYASGSMSFSLVSIRDATVAQCSAPPSEPANNAFLSLCGSRPAGRYHHADRAGRADHAVAFNARSTATIVPAGGSTGPGSVYQVRSNHKSDLLFDDNRSGDDRDQRQLPKCMTETVASAANPPDCGRG